MRDKYNLNLLPKGQEEAEYEDDNVATPSIPGMGFDRSLDEEEEEQQHAEMNGPLIPGLGGAEFQEKEEPQRKVPFAKPIPKQFQQQWNSEKKRSSPSLLPGPSSNTNGPPVSHPPSGEMQGMPGPPPGLLGTGPQMINVANHSLLGPGPPRFMPPRGLPHPPSMPQNVQMPRPMSGPNNRFMVNNHSLPPQMVMRPRMQNNNIHNNNIQDQHNFRMRQPTPSSIPSLPPPPSIPSQRTDFPGQVPKNRRPESHQDTDERFSTRSMHFDEDLRHRDFDSDERHFDRQYDNDSRSFDPRKYNDRRNYEERNYPERQFPNDRPNYQNRSYEEYDEDRRENDWRRNDHQLRERHDWRREEGEREAMSYDSDFRNTAPKRHWNEGPGDMLYSDYSEYDERQNRPWNNRKPVSPNGVARDQDNRY